MRILSLDGGGIFGAHTAVILDRLEAACPGFLESVDLVAGTSIGGMLALAIANGSTAPELVSLCDDAKAFFTTDWSRRVAAEVGALAKYDNSGRTAVMAGILGTKKLGDLAKHVVVQSFQLNGKPSWTSAVFHNLPSRPGVRSQESGVSQKTHGLTDPCPLTPEPCSKHPDSCGMLAVDAGVATSAAPIYFPAAGNYIDGGVVANDPSMTALALALDPSLDWKLKGTPLSQIDVFSVGRTYPGDEVDRTNWDAGWLQWSTVVLNVLLTGGQGVVDYQCQQLLGDNYFRHCPAVPVALNFAIDAVAAVPKLVAWAQGLDLAAEVAWLKAHW